MKNLTQQFIRDERGHATSMGIILVVTIVSIASMVGLAVVRDQVTQQFGDIGAALGTLDQSFSYSINIDGGPVEFESTFVDGPDPLYTDPAPTGAPGSGAPACLTFVTPGATEGS